MKAVVLLSTYRGAKYLPEMIGSLRAQDWPSIEVIVRDDGSDDDTCKVLSDAAYESMRVIQGRNVGAKQSFHLLLREAPLCDAVFFADQDDVWHIDKVRRAVSALTMAPADQPVLYCSALDIVDAELHSLGTSPIWPQRPSFSNALVENVATGCTIALNWAAVELLRSKPMPDAAIMHDWWAYLVISAFGTVVYDPVPSIRYRMHAQNQIGLPTNHASWLFARIRRRLQGSSIDKLIEQGRVFDATFGDRLDPDQGLALDQLLALKSFAGRLSFLSQPRLYRQFKTDQWALKVLVALGGTR